MSALGPQQITQAAQRISDAFTGNTLLDGLGDLTPPDEATAEAISDASADLLGLPVAGWKVGATSEAARKILRCPGPFAGRVFTPRVFAGEFPAHVIANALIECEFAFMLGADLPVRDEPWTAEEVRGAIASVAPAIEVVGPRMSDFGGVGYLSLIADHGANGGVMIGEPVPTADLPDLASVAVKCEIDGAVVAEGTGANIMGDPWASPLWLAEHLRTRNIALAAGQLIMSGTCTGVSPLAPGSSITAHHVGLGSVTLAHAD